MASSIEEPTTHDREERERVSQRLVMSELVSILAHDVNQPLAAVVTNANACRRWLANDPPDLGEASAAAERIAHEGLRASQIIERMRVLLQGNTQVLEAVPLERVFQQWLTDVAEAAAAAGTTLRAVEPAVPSVWCDRSALQHVLLNLTDNALEAMRTGGTQPRVLELSAVRKGETEVCIRVRDSGPGLGADRELAFRAFYSSKPRGLGLGLSVCRSLVRSVGGRLWASANEQGGETFSFTLPIAADAR